MKTAKEYRADAIDLKHRLAGMRRAAMGAQARANAAQLKLDKVAMLAAGMRVGGSPQMADALDEILSGGKAARR